MAVVVPPAPFPEAFARAVARLVETPLRPEITLHEGPAPQRLAPHAVALHAEVTVADDDVATGRLIVLHDPARPDAWDGDTRIVAYLRAPLEPEMAGDPLLSAVGWSWLLDALAASDAAHTKIGGTVTTVTSERFGALADEPDAAEVELRASWTPVGDDLRPHVQGFGELLCMAAGLPPLAPGVLPLARPRKRARHQG